jgi:hypothetical protein
MLCDDGCSGKCDGDCIEPSPTNPRAQDVLHRVGHGDALLRYAQVACAAFVEFQSLSSELTLFHNGSACKCSRNSTQSALGTMHFLSSQMRATHPGSPPRITAFAGPAYPGPLHSTPQPQCGAPGIFAARVTANSTAAHQLPPPPGSPPA